MKFVHRLLPPFIGFLLRTLAFTLRFRIIDQCGITRGPLRPVIAALWHNRLLIIPVAYQRYCRGRRGSCLTSPSKDGTILAEVSAGFNIGSVRGSSSRRGATALLELATLLRLGEDVAFTPDGPRGPKYVIGPGVIKLAQITGAPVMPVHIAYASYWELKSWDAFRIPKPFSRVEVVFGPLYQVCPTSDEAGFEAERVRLQNHLLDEIQAADRRVREK